MQAREENFTSTRIGAGFCQSVWLCSASALVMPGARLCFFSGSHSDGQHSKGSQVCISVAAGRQCCAMVADSACARSLVHHGGDCRFLDTKRVVVLTAGGIGRWRQRSARPQWHQAIHKTRAGRRQRATCLRSRTTQLRSCSMWDLR
jgi:hypothetical protein